jgi:hypothetical protein
MDLQYQLRAGSYYLYDMRDTPSPLTGERRIRLKTELVAIAFDEVTGHVHQHGSATRINSWALRARRLLRAAGRWDEANSIVVISGPLPVDEINKCLWVHGYCQRMLQRLKWLPHGKLQTGTGHMSARAAPATVPIAKPPDFPFPACVNAYRNIDKIGHNRLSCKRKQLLLQEYLLHHDVTVIGCPFRLLFRLRHRQ